MSILNKLDHFIVVNNSAGYFKTVKLTKYINYLQKFQHPVHSSCLQVQVILAFHSPGNTKGGSITVPLTSCFIGLDQPVLQIKTKIVSCPSPSADSKPVKQEVNSTVILPLQYSLPNLNYFLETPLINFQGDLTPPPLKVRPDYRCRGTINGGFK